jgi:hypothetical protein
MLKHVMLSRVVPVNEEVNIVEPVLEEERSPVEVGFNMRGTDPEPKIPVDKGKPRMHLNPNLSFQSFISLMLMRCCIM